MQCGMVKQTIGAAAPKGEDEDREGETGSLEHDVPNEIWSLGGISQRLFAGAMGTGFIPTNR